MLRDTVNIFKEIQSTSGRNNKEDILRKHKNNEEFKYILEFLFNPYKLTGIKFKKAVKYATFISDNVKQFTSIYEAIEYIIKNNTGRDEDIMTIMNFINTYDTDIQSPVHNFLQEFFTKDFKCGITASTINKVYGKNFIPKFDVLLAKKYEDEQHKIKGEFGVTLKLDGIRCVAIKENGLVSFFTRQGQPIDGLIEIAHEFKDYPDNTVYDGELLLIDETGMPSDELFRVTQKEVRTDGEKRNVVFHMFDVLPLEEFKAGNSIKTYKQRREELDYLTSQYMQFYIRTVPLLYYGKDKSEIYRLLDKVVAEGKEGVMVSNGSGYYVTKRSDNLLKVKKMHTVDLEIIGYEEGTGKNVGKLGALIVDYKGFPCGVGSGFTDHQREEFWNSKDELINRVAEVQYFEESNNEQGGISLRFPVFKQLREEGKEVSYY
ncbi:ATP-dependent DNA ligase [Cytobacillus praedii]|uniref:ATP-dependent DNA ligase n=1 Tax=Cytobacillus praedii TaxID=1742358 RepID=A0A4V2NTQ0_9BACI|nr:ATP-dependent DNA ligase [Cytobacillus praedii]TCJ01142.1 ATP-dependent DNA ligase [Cytobacillus praedii]